MLEGGSIKDIEKAYKKAVDSWKGKYTSLVSPTREPKAPEVKPVGVPRVVLDRYVSRWIGEDARD